MPNYNKGKYLVKAIKSVLNQSFRNWKLYIIDDASNDDSVKILKKFKKNKIDAILVFAWNYFDEIKKKNRKITKKFIKVF